MDQEHDFVMTHVVFLVDIRPPPGWEAARIAPRRSWTDAVGQGLPTRGSRALSQFDGPVRSEEHTSELQSLMRISYAVFCLKKKKKQNTTRQKQEMQKQ